MIWGKESPIDPHRHIISIFDPKYNQEKDEIEWNVIFSKETTEYTHYCIEGFIVDFLKENDDKYNTLSILLQETDENKRW